MNETPRKFILVHGAWHNGSAWAGVAAELRRAGHDVEAPTLPGMNSGDRRSGIGFGDLVEAIVEVLRRQPGKVIVVGHSSAGVLLQAAVPRAAEKVELVVFNNAFVLRNGENQLDNLPPEAASWLTSLSQTTPDGTVPVEPIETFVRGVLMQGDAVETQDALLKRLLPQPFALLSTPVDTRPFEALAVRKAVLFCERDRSANYLAMARRLSDYRILTVNGSHEMLFAEPAEYTRALLKLSTLTS